MRAHGALTNDRTDCYVSWLTLLDSRLYDEPPARRALAALECNKKPAAGYPVAGRWLLEPVWPLSALASRSGAAYSEKYSFWLVRRSCSRHGAHYTRGEGGILVSVTDESALAKSSGSRVHTQPPSRSPRAFYRLADSAEDRLTPRPAGVSVRICGQAPTPSYS